jgi:hypothetical protein
MRIGGQNSGPVCRYVGRTTRGLKTGPLGPSTNEFKQSYWLKALNPKAFKRGSRTKKWQIEAKPTWHLFWREINWFRPKKQC